MVPKTGNTFYLIDQKAKGGFSFFTVYIVNLFSYCVFYFSGAALIDGGIRKYGFPFEKGSRDRTVYLQSGERRRLFIHQIHFAQYTKAGFRP